MVNIQDIVAVMINKYKMIALILISVILVFIIYLNSLPTSYYKNKESKVYYYTDKNNNKIPVPVGFTVLNDNVNDGLVIIDNTNDITNGNEFVWVPVKEFKRINYSYSFLGFKNYNMNFVDKKEYNAIKESVKKYNGFYIGRFESSKSENKINDVSIASVKANKIPWTEIQYSTNMNDIYGYSNGALRISKYTYINNDNVNSTLTYPEHFDSIISWFLSFDELKTDGNYIISNDDILVDSKNIRNNDINLTGSNINNCIKNICDIASNVAELTTESYFGNYHIVRGSKSLTYKRNLDAYTTHNWVGFRLVLII